MSTLVEIQEAALKLNKEEKKALSLWLESQIEPELRDDEEQLLLRSLDAAIGDIDSAAERAFQSKMRAKAWLHGLQNNFRASGYRRFGASGSIHRQG